MFVPASKSLWSAFIALGLLAVVTIHSCKKDDFNTSKDFNLSFSSDTVFFDTVFTSIGSVTKYITVHNHGKEAVKISSIRLAGGNSSFYRINIDGEPVLEANDVELRGEDSLYVFVRVTIDPDEKDNPFVVSDSIIFITNGNVQDVDLVSWGQNAHYILADTYIQGYPEFKIVAHGFEEVTWKPDKPYVIYGFAVVDSNGTLSVERGTQVYFHHNSGLWIYKGGRLLVNGTVDAPVFFQGDRLEPFYRDLPGQWDRIWINEGSQDNRIEYAVIRNGFIGIQAEVLQQKTGNKLILSNTVIENMTGLGLLSRYYDITAYNNVVSNCGQYLAALTWGGAYDFRHCTFANYWSESVRVTPSLILNNYFTDPESNVYACDLQAYFGNCILDGRNEEELEFLSDEGAAFDYRFEHSLVRTLLDVSDPVHYSGILVNQDSIFLDPVNNNFMPDTLSPAIDAGSPSVIVGSAFDISRDILEVSRITDPDAGAYEFVKPPR
jgi:hypothetical protein